MQKVLVADISGAQARFGLASSNKTTTIISDYLKLATTPFYSFDLCLEEYLSKVSLPISELHAVFGVAGTPVINTAEVSKSDWFLDGNSIAKKYGLKSVKLVNDFHALARSIPELDQTCYKLIRNGTPDLESPIIVAGADLGLGVATLLPSDKNIYTVISGEGGHSSYTPNSKIEFELAKLLTSNNDHVSTEMVCSSVSYQMLYKALCQIFKRDAEKVSELESFERAKNGDELFKELHSIRANCLMGMVGDLVLINGARGGVVLAGELSKRLEPYLNTPTAIERFENKGIKKEYMRNCPIHLLLEPHASLIGAGAIHFETLL